MNFIDTIRKYKKEKVRNIIKNIENIGIDEELKKVESQIENCKRVNYLRV
jgi:uncharacterized protein (UPF0128 family)